MFSRKAFHYQFSLRISVTTILQSFLIPSKSYSGTFPMMSSNKSKVIPVSYKTNKSQRCFSFSNHKFRPPSSMTTNFIPVMLLFSKLFFIAAYTKISNIEILDISVPPKPYSIKEIGLLLSFFYLTVSPF